MFAVMLGALPELLPDNLLTALNTPITKAVVVLVKVRHVSGAVEDTTRYAVLPYVHVV